MLKVIFILFSWLKIFLHSACWIPKVQKNIKLAQGKKPVRNTQIYAFLGLNPPLYNHVIPEYVNAALLNGGRSRSFCLHCHLKSMDGVSFEGGFIILNDEIAHFLTTEVRTYSVW